MQLMYVSMECRCLETFIDVAFSAQRTSLTSITPAKALLAKLRMAFLSWYLRAVLALVPRTASTLMPRPWRQQCRGKAYGTAVQTEQHHDAISSSHRMMSAHTLGACHIKKHVTCRLQKLHSQVSVALTEDLQDSCDQASRTITLVQEGIIQHQLLHIAAKCHSINEEFTYCTRAFRCLDAIASLSDGLGALSVDEESLLVAADTVVTNLRGVVEAVQDFRVRAIGVCAIEEYMHCRCFAAQNGPQPDSSVTCRQYQCSCMPWFVKSAAMRSLWLRERLSPLQLLSSCNALLHVQLQSVLFIELRIRHAPQ